MKTTIEIDEALLARAKQLAAGRRQPLRELVEQGLRTELGKAHRRPTVNKSVKWVTVNGGLPKNTNLANREQMMTIFGRPL